MRRFARNPVVALCAVLVMALIALPAAADQCILDDLIVDGSACIGFDCVCGESFGFDTVRLKENNLRITFIDTSTASSFPRGDWQIRANESANGGANEFAIDWLGTNATSGSSVVATPFAIEGNAPNNALYVDDGGRVGFGTSIPSVELHTVDGDTPTLRLAQDGSSGFTPQTWDVAGNETNFFVRDVTNGSQLPFRIRPDAPTNSIFIQNDGTVGLGTSSPAANLHVVETTAGLNNVLRTVNNGTSTWLATDSSGAGNSIVFNMLPNSAADGFSFGGTINAANSFAFNFNNGNLTIDGDFITDANTYPDYVFEPGYELMSLADLAVFIASEGHLPNVPSQADVDAAGGKIRLNELQLALLEKVEELTLYTIDQQRSLAALETANDELRRRLDALESP